MKWLEGSLTLLRLGRMALAQVRVPEVLNPSSDQITDQFMDASEALIVARRGDFELLERTSFEAPMHVDGGEFEARAFWINLYNTLTLHAMHRAGIRQSVLERPDFFVRYAYRVGKYHFNLNDIEHGVLRGNRAPFLGRVPFVKDDPRVQFALSIDPRIHFALNCGALSCPPIRVYQGLHLTDQLDLAAQSYLQDAKLEGNTVWLPRLLTYYPKDFGDPLEYARTYRPDLPASSRVKFLPYSWDNI
jgi:hypothetical protein